MKKLLIAAVCCLYMLKGYAQNRNDTTAYEMQRKRINSMLNQRELKFDQYEESLSKHTGIFGLQTKNDIRNSNVILMDITNADNQIFKQLKILLDYRAFEQKQVQDQASQVQTSNMAYMNAINKLRNQNDQLNKALNKAHDEHEKAKSVYLGIIVLLIVTSILLLLTQKRSVKA